MKTKDTPRKLLLGKKTVKSLAVRTQVNAGMPESHMNCGTSVGIAVC